MQPDASNLTAARKLMVDGQVRPNKVTDPRIIAAMRSLPRERFLPPHLAALAYADEDVQLGGGRFLMEPMVIARLVQIAAVRPGERALVVASGAGYGAALLAACGAQVTALEEDPALLALARGVLGSLAPSVTLVSGPLAAGWPAGGPYDVVLIEGGVEDVPACFAAQVKPEGGRLLTVRVGLASGALAGGAGLGQAVLGEPSGGLLALQPLFDCAVPLLAAMRRPTGFVF